MASALQVASRSLELPKSPTKAGGLVVRAAKGRHEVLLISSVSRRGRWTLPKGSLEDGEHPAVTATREIAEEAGVSGRLVRTLGVIARHPHTIAFFLFRYQAEVEWMEIGIRERRWVSLDKAERHLRQTDLHEIIAAARQVIGSR